jgi:hypothetical protein
MHEIRTSWLAFEIQKPDFVTAGVGGVSGGYSRIERFDGGVRPCSSRLRCGLDFGLVRPLLHYIVVGCKVCKPGRAEENRRITLSFNLQS